MSSSTSNTKNQPITGGDDLDDDLDLQPDFMAASDAEDDDEQDAIMSNGDEEDLPNPRQDEDESAFISEDEEAGPAKPVVKKRKAEEERPTPNNASGSGSNAPLSEADKKKKRKLKEKERKEKRKIREEQAKQPHEMSTQELDEFFFESLKKTYRLASDMELADLRIPANVLQSTSSFTEPRDLDFLPAFIKAQVPQLPKRLKKAGTPSLIVLSPSGIRAADVVRSLKSVRVPEGETGEETGKPPGEVGKLFAKHFKVSEHIEYLEKTKIWAAAGTPGRISKILAESDALTIRQQTVILLDLSYRDSKNRTLLSIPEIRDEFWKVLFGDKKVREKILATGVKIAVF